MGCGAVGVREGTVRLLLVLFIIGGCQGVLLLIWEAPRPSEAKLVSSPTQRQHMGLSDSYTHTHTLGEQRMIGLIIRSNWIGYSCLFYLFCSILPLYPSFSPHCIATQVLALGNRRREKTSKCQPQKHTHTHTDMSDLNIYPVCLLGDLWKAKCVQTNIAFTAYNTNMLHHVEFTMAQFNFPDLLSCTASLLTTWFR